MENLNYLENKVSNLHLFFENKNIYKNLESSFKKFLNINSNKVFLESSVKDDLGSLLGAAELIFKGWHNEAIPFSNKKKSIISGFFERFF